jgi:hypothetical protein
MVILVSFNHLIDRASDKSGILEVWIYYMSFMRSTDDLLDLKIEEGLP